MKTKCELEKIIESSDNIVTALEALAPEYSIPKENILRDDSLSKIRVKNDMIVAPAKPTKGNTNAIICSIGAVLDYISQRIDSKLDAFQKYNYDKTFNVNDKEPIPTNDDSGKKSFFTEEKPSYYTDVDDITRGVDMDMSKPSVSDNPIPTDVPETIHESSIHVDWYDKYGFNMGYELFQSLGFSNIKPVESFMVEGAGPELSSFDTMKFDNKHLLNAVKCFNEARAEQSETTAKTFDYERFVSSQKFLDGVDEISEQFDARIAIRYLKTKENVQSGYGNAATLQFKTYNKVTISKSKGFQLNRMPIDIFLIDSMLIKMFPKDQQYFGQTICGILLHEIFHNIYARLFIKETEFRTAMDSMFTSMDAITDKKEQKKYMNKFIDYLVDIDVIDKKAKNPITKSVLSSKLRLISATRSKEAFQYLSENKPLISGKELNEKEIDDMIKHMEEMNIDVDKKIKQSRIKLVISIIGGAGSLITAGLVGKEADMLIGVLGTVGVIASLHSLACLVDIMSYKELKVMNNKYDASKNFEEYWCDLFAGMYNVPVSWILGIEYSKGRGGSVANNFRNDQLQKYADLDVAINRLYFSSYPSTAERLYSATKMAKTALESGADLSPEFKSYLEWIVENNDKILASGIDKKYNKVTFDPKETDTKKHLETLVNKADKSNPTLTD